MKLNRGFSLNSLPFVKSSQTVSRDNSRSCSSNEQPSLNKTPPISSSSRSRPYATGMRILSDHVSVTVRRPSARDKRKWPIPSSLVDSLPPPSSLKRRSKCNEYNDSVSHKRPKRMSCRDIQSHVAMVKSKQHNNTSINSSQYGVPVQEVPLSPSSLVLSEATPTSYHGNTANEPWTNDIDSDSFVDSLGKREKPLSLDFSKTLSNVQDTSTSPLFPLINEPGCSSYLSLLSSPAALTDTSFTDFKPRPHSPFATPTLDMGVAHRYPELAEEYVIPVRCETTPIPERFDQRTFGIKMLFPREE